MEPLRTPSMIAVGCLASIARSTRWVVRCCDWWRCHQGPLERRLKLFVGPSNVSHTTKSSPPSPGNWWSTCRNTRPPDLSEQVRQVMVVSPQMRDYIVA
jgi:hypothetical protein